MGSLRGRIGDSRIPSDHRLSAGLYDHRGICILDEAVEGYAQHPERGS